MAGTYQTFQGLYNSNPQAAMQYLQKYGFSGPGGGFWGDVLKNQFGGDENKYSNWVNSNFYNGGATYSVDENGNYGGNYGAGSVANPSANFGSNGDGMLNRNNWSNGTAMAGVGDMTPGHGTGASVNPGTKQMDWFANAGMQWPGAGNVGADNNSFGRGQVNALGAGVGTNTDPTGAATDGAPAAGGAGNNGSQVNAGAGGAFDYFNDPGYQFRLNEGTKALNSSAAARGSMLSGQSLKDLANYSQGLASQEYGNAFDRYANQRNFTQAQNLADRQFDYNANTGDRDFNYQRLRDLMNWGLAGQGGMTSNNNWLATLLNSNILGAGNAGAAAGIGNNNTINNSLSQMLQQYLMRQMMGG